MRRKQRLILIHFVMQESTKVMLLTQEILKSVSLKAKESPRLRMNFNVHASIEDKVHRMFNAMEPGTIVPIHRHQFSDETMVMLRGSLRVNLYDSNGNITESHILKANSPVFGIDIKTGIYHGVEVLEEGTVMLEIKEGPYEPLKSEDILESRQ